MQFSFSTTLLTLSNLALSRFASKRFAPFVQDTYKKYYVRYLRMTELIFAKQQFQRLDLLTVGGPQLQLLKLADGHTQPF